MAAIRSVVIALLIVVIGAKPSEAESADTYDLDSLAWIATDIVEGKLIRLNEDIYGVSTIEVTAVHEGDLKVGDAIPIHFLNSYRKAGARVHQSEPLEPGDRLVLFLRPAESAEGFTPGAPNAMLVVASGIRLIHGGQVVAFVQYSNPGYPVAAVGAPSQTRKRKNLEQFRSRIAAAIDTATNLERRFAEPSSPDDVPALLDLLHKRIARPAHRIAFPFGPNRDKAAEEVCLRLANMHHIEGLNTAAFLDLPFGWCRNIIGKGFRFPAGRDFLLARIADSNQPMKRRLRYAQILRDAGREYHASYTDIEAGSASIVGLGRDDNAGYLTRVAHATAGVMEQEELCLAMLLAMERFASSLPGRPDDDPIREDLRGGLPELVELHRQTDSVRMRYHVENVIALISRSKYESLGSKCGPILSLVQPDNRKGFDEPDSDEFDFGYRIIVLDGSSIAEAELVFMHEKSGHEFTTPFEIRHRGRRGHTGFRSVALPVNLPTGRYRVFMRFVRDGNVISEGYGFETEL